MNLLRGAAAAMFFACACGAIAAQQVKVVLDPQQTQIDWTLNATLHAVHGSFKLKSGQIIFDPSSGVATGELLVDATTGSSGNRLRDSKMQKDVLDTKRYPEITFMPKRVTGTLTREGQTTLQVEGVFHIHGSDHEMTISVPINRHGTNLKGSSSFTIPYQAWGMKNPGSMLLHVDDKVQITIDTVGNLTLPDRADLSH